MNRIKLTKNFYLSEFECHDGDHLVKLDERLLLLLQNLRDSLNRPIRILSGFRTIAHNDSVGRSPKSQHLHGKAADIQVENLTPQEVFIHVCKNGFDVRERKVYWKG